MVFSGQPLHRHWSSSYLMEQRTSHLQLLVSDRAKILTRGEIQSPEAFRDLTFYSLTNFSYNFLVHCPGVAFKFVLKCTQQAPALGIYTCSCLSLEPSSTECCRICSLPFWSSLLQCYVITEALPGSTIKMALPCCYSLYTKYVLLLFIALITVGYIIQLSTY